MRGAGATAERPAMRKTSLLLALVGLMAAAPAGTPPRAENRAGEAVQFLLAALPAAEPRVPRQTPAPGARLAQEVTCPYPNQGELYCGIYDNTCLYCPDWQPFICIAQGMCFERQEDAQATCGWDFSICGAPVQ